MTTMELIERGIGHNCLSDAYELGRADAIKEYHDKLSKEMHDLWRFYKADTNNRPKPNFMCAYSMVDLIAEQLKEQK